MEIEVPKMDFEVPKLGDDFDINDSQPLSKDTSDALAKSAKTFLTENNIRTDGIKEKTFLIIRNVLLDLTLPQKNEVIRIRTQQQINLISMVLKILKVHGTIDDLLIATYTLNKEALLILIDALKNGKIKKMSLFLASSYSFRDKNYFQHLKEIGCELKNKFDFHLAFAWLHFKITTVKCGDDFYHIEGSMNYSQNNMAEQLHFENCQQSYEHDYGFITEMISRQAETNKAVEVVC